MTDSQWSALGSISAAITAIFTAAMAIAVIVTAVYARRTLIDARDDSRARTRPALAAYLEPELLSHGSILLVIKNFGPSGAADVRVSFEPSSPSIEAVNALPDSDMFKWIYLRFAEAIPYWAPGWATSNIVRAGDENVFLRLTVHLSYSGSDGTRYAERFPLNPDVVLKRTSAGPSKPDNLLAAGQQGVAALQALVRTTRTK